MADAANAMARCAPPATMLWVRPGRPRPCCFSSSRRTPKRRGCCAAQSRRNRRTPRARQAKRAPRHRAAKRCNAAAQHLRAFLARKQGRQTRDDMELTLSAVDPSAGTRCRKPPPLPHLGWRREPTRLGRVRQILADVAQIRTDLGRLRPSSTEISPISVESAPMLKMFQALQGPIVARKSKSRACAGEMRPSSASHANMAFHSPGTRSRPPRSARCHAVGQRHALTKPAMPAKRPAGSARQQVLRLHIPSGMGAQDQTQLGGGGGTCCGPTLQRIPGFWGPRATNHGHDPHRAPHGWQQLVGVLVVDARALVQRAVDVTRRVCLVLAHRLVDSKAILV